MATSGAQLRALVMQANAEAEQAKSMLMTARVKLEEVREQYRRISEKLEPAVILTQNAIGDTETSQYFVDQAIDKANQYAATVA